ncbi:hypothetical protein B0H14DRAFT_3475060 [Mycena olivaceomarginata]|nr:hypothetical protein B0H14DRAFT_3475060 [Mycena olivaceomarginata]
MAGRRTLRSGKEFSAFDLAVCRAISPPVHFDAGECLMQRLLEEPRDEDEAVTEPQPFWLDVDATELRHSNHGWQGSAAADKDAFEFRARQAPHDLETGLGGVRLYVYQLARPPHDSLTRRAASRHRRPWRYARDHAGWKTVTDGAAALLEERQPRIKLTQEALHHRRAQDAFPAIARSVAHGGGRMEPGEVHQNVANTLLTDELRAHDYIQRIMLFASSLILLWAPLLNAFYLVNKTLLSAWKPSMRWHLTPLFAACTFNFGPRAITRPPTSTSQTLLGAGVQSPLSATSTPTFSGHLILWDSPPRHSFPPPGSTLLIPSALYTAGSLFRWVRNGCQTDAAFQSSASTEEKAVRAAEDAQRWEEGVKNVFCR